jgi:CheY-like chemotaxis protein
MKILILDDQPERHEGFLVILRDHQLVHAWTYTQAVSAFKTQDFDMACLDHDLGDLGCKPSGHIVVPAYGAPVEVESRNFKLSYSPDFVADGMYDASRRFLDGRDVCDWLVQNPARCPQQVWVHSHNTYAAKQMADALKFVSGVKVILQAYRAPTAQVKL